MLSRPVVLAPVMGWALGDAQGGLLVGVRREVLFLGGGSLGGSLPDNESLLSAVLTAMLVPAGVLARTGVDPPLAALGLILLFPLALFGRRLERASEVRNQQLMAEVQERSAHGEPAPVHGVSLRGLLLPFGASAGICALAVLVSPLLASLRAGCGPGALASLEGGWHAIWAVAAACAIRALRDPPAPLVGAPAAAAGVR